MQKILQIKNYHGKPIGNILLSFIYIKSVSFYTLSETYHFPKEILKNRSLWFRSPSAQKAIPINKTKCSCGSNKFRNCSLNIKGEVFATTESFFLQLRSTKLLYQRLNNTVWPRQNRATLQGDLTKHPVQIRKY